MSLRAETDFKPELKWKVFRNTCEVKFGGMKPVNKNYYK